MTQPVVVANSSPFIALERIGQLTLLPAMIGKVSIPPAVRSEVFGLESLPEWVEERPITQPLAPRMTATHLGPGEREAIALALELGAAELLLDDLPASHVATSLAVPVIGTLGLLLHAKKRRLIPQVRPLIEALQQQDFRISERLFDGILQSAGELRSSDSR